MRRRTGATVDYRGIFNRAVRNAGLNCDREHRAGFVADAKRMGLSVPEAKDYAENVASMWLTMQRRPTPYDWHDDAPEAEAMLDAAYQRGRCPVMTIRELTEQEADAMMVGEGWEAFDA